MIVTIATDRLLYSVHTSAALGANSYALGYCVRNVSGVAINKNDFSVGWAMITAY